MKHTIKSDELADQQFQIQIASGDTATRKRKRLVYIATYDMPNQGLIYVDWLVEGKLWQNEWAGSDGLEAIRRYNEL